MNVKKVLVWRGRSVFLATRWVENLHTRCRHLLDDRLIQIRPGNLKAITDALDLSSNYGQTSKRILIHLTNTCIVILQQESTLNHKDERPHVAAFPFGASFSLLAFRAHIPIDKWFDHTLISFKIK